MANAPKLWPALPRSRSTIVPGASPSRPARRAISPERNVPTARSVLPIAAASSTGSPCSIARATRGSSERSTRASVAYASRARPRARRRALATLCRGDQRRQVERLAAALAQQVGAADGLVERAQAERREDLAQLLGDVQEVRDDLLGRAREAPAQLGILRGDAHRAGVEVADAHHDAARRDQRCGREGELLGAEQRRDEHVASRAERAVDLQADAAAQVVRDQHLLRLGDAELPGQAGVLERRGRRRAGAAVVPGDHDVVGLRLGDAGGDGADAGLGDQLDADRGARVDRPQVVDQLREILDRVDVVVRRRRDQADAGRRVPQPRDQVVDLEAGQLAALAGLRALRDLDLQLVGIREVAGRHAEARGRDLLDRRAAQVAVRVRRGARRDPRRPRRCSSARRGGSSRSRGSRAPRSRSSRATSRPWRSGARSRSTARPRPGGWAARRAAARAGCAASSPARRPRRSPRRTRGTSGSSRRARRAAASRSSRGSRRGARPRCGTGRGRPPRGPRHRSPRAGVPPHRPRCARARRRRRARSCP